MLAVAVVAVLAATGAAAPDVPPSTLRVLVAAVVALLAPLLWPGLAATPARTILRIAAWSAAAAALAVLLMRFVGQAPQSLPKLAQVGAMLLLVLLGAHALVALVEAAMRRRSADAPAARTCAGATVAALLALLGALPLWLGPLGEWLTPHHDRALDTVIGLSPLTHLAVASGNDLLRNEWFYEHSALAGQSFAYPELVTTASAYAAVGMLLALVALAARRPRRSGDGHTPIDPPTEKAR
jgi:hypothetical protein